MKKLATKLTPAIKSWIEKEFGSDRYDNIRDGLFHWHSLKNINGSYELYTNLLYGYTEVSEAEFLAEFGKPKVEYQYFTGGKWQDIDMPVRIKPTPDYSPEIEALQAKAKENGMTVTINFEKL